MKEGRTFGGAIKQDVEDTEGGNRICYSTLTETYNSTLISPPSPSPPTGLSIPNIQLHKLHPIPSLLLKIHNLDIFIIHRSMPTNMPDPFNLKLFPTTAPDYLVS